MSLTRKILRGFVWNHLGRVSEYFLVYLFSLIVARRLGAELTGVYAMVQGVAQMLLVVSAFGLESAVHARMPELFKTTGMPRIRGLVQRMLAARGVAAILVGGCFLLLRGTIVDLLNAPPLFLDVLFALLLYFFFRSIVSLLTAFHYARLETLRPSIVAVVVRSGEVVLALILFHLGFGLPAIIALIAFSACAQALVLSSTLKDLLIGPVERTPLWPLISLGGKFWANGMMEFVLGKQFTVLLLGFFFVGTASIGHFEVAVSMANVINFGMTSGLFGLSVASLSAIANAETRLLRQYWEFLSRTVVLLVVPVFVFAGFFAGEIVPFLYTGDFAASVLLFQILAIFLVATRVVGGGVASDFLHSESKTKILFAASGLGAIVNLGLGLLLIPRYGAMGAVFALGIATLSITAVHAYYAVRMFRVNLPLSSSLVVIGLSLASGFLSWWVGQGIFGGGLIVSLLIFIGTFLIFSYALKPLRIEDLQFLQEFQAGIARYIAPFTRTPIDSVAAELTDRHKWAFAWLPRCGVLVDIGASNSPLTRFAVLKAGIAIAIDTDRVALRALERNGGGAFPLQARAERLPLPSASVDAALLLDVLEHVSEESKVVDEVYRVLRPGGTLILSVPYKGMFRFLDPLNLAPRIKGDRGRPFHKHYSDSELTRMLFRKFRLRRKHYGGLFLYPMTFGLDNFLKKHCGLDWSRTLRNIGDLDYDISWGRLSYNVVILAEKI